ncbi:MAG: hypothetical protein ACP5HZ_09410 [Ferrimicrobium sp.]
MPRSTLSGPSTMVYSVRETITSIDLVAKTPNHEDVEALVRVDSKRQGKGRTCPLVDDGRSSKGASALACCATLDLWPSRLLPVDHQEATND